MVATFVRLKLTLLANRVKSRERAWLVLVGSIAGALASGLVGFSFTAAARVLDMDVAQAATRAGITSVFLGWLATPFFLTGADEVLESRRLALLPLRARDLLWGMAAASWLAVSPFVTLLTVLGSVVGLGRDVLAAIAAATGAVLVALLCVFTSKALSTAAAAAMSARRGRDIAIAAITLFVGFGSLAASVLSRAVAERSDLLFTLGAIARFTPPGAAVSAGPDMSAGRYGWLAFDLLMPLAVLLAVLAWWALALRRAMTTSMSSAGQVTERVWTRRWWGAATRAGAVAGRMWRYIRRSSRYRLSIPLGTVTGVFMALAPHLSEAGPRAPLVYVGVYVAVWIGVMGMNMPGTEGSAGWIHVAVPGRTGADWVGRLGVYCLAGLVPALGASVVAAVITGNGGRLPGALAIAATALAAALSCGAVHSVLFPFPAPGDDHSAFGTVQGGSRFLGLFAMGMCLVGTVVLTAPVGFLALATDATSFGGLLPLLGMAYAATVITVGARVAGAIQDRRGPEILAAVSKG